MRLFLFSIGMFLLLLTLLFTHNEKDGWVPIIAYALSLGTITILIIIDRYRHPDIYKKGDK